MKAKEIREIKSNTSDFPYASICVFLREIAAQLAEINEALRDLSVTTYKS